MRRSERLAPAQNPDRYRRRQIAVEAACGGRWPPQQHRYRMQGLCGSVVSRCADLLWLGSSARSNAGSKPANPRCRQRSSRSTWAGGLRPIRRWRISRSGWWWRRLVARTGLIVASLYNRRLLIDEQLLVALRGHPAMLTASGDRGQSARAAGGTADARHFARAGRSLARRDLSRVGSHADPGAVPCGRRRRSDVVVAARRRRADRGACRSVASAGKSAASGACGSIATTAAR